MRLTEQNVRNFWAKVSKRGHDGCWAWTGGLFKLRGGYGRFAVNCRSERAHRVSWEIDKWRRPPRNKLVCHSCDNPRCVRPSHLFLGTPQSNTDDMIRKGRQRSPGVRRGTANHAAKLTPDHVRLMRRLRRRGAILRELSERFGVSIATVHSVVTGQHWRHIN